IPARHAHRRHARPLPRRSAGPRQHAKLLLQVLPPVFADPRRRCAADGEAREEEEQATQRHGAAHLRAHAVGDGRQARGGQREEQPVRGRGQVLGGRGGAPGGQGARPAGVV
ncbi:hypothetical protein BN1708_019267, partial [Verticillium longisporum]